MGQHALRQEGDSFAREAKPPVAAPRAEGGGSWGNHEFPHVEKRRDGTRRPFLELRGRGSDCRQFPTRSYASYRQDSPSA